MICFSFIIKKLRTIQRSICRQQIHLKCIELYRKIFFLKFQKLKNNYAFISIRSFFASVLTEFLSVIYWTCKLSIFIRKCSRTPYETIRIVYFSTIESKYTEPIQSFNLQLRQSSIILKTMQVIILTLNDCQNIALYTLSLMIGLLELFIPIFRATDY